MSFRPFLRAFFRAPRPPYAPFGRLVVLHPLHSRIGTLPILAGAVALGSAAYYGTKTSQGTAGKLPSLPTVVTVLDLEAATAKLREEEHTGNFGGDSGNGDTKHGIFFRVRLPSNHPVEDEYVYGTAAGVGGKPWEFWGVFDGHAYVSRPVYPSVKVHTDLPLTMNLQWLGNFRRSKAIHNPLRLTIPQGAPFDIFVGQCYLRHQAGIYSSRHGNILQCPFRNVSESYVSLYSLRHCSCHRWLLRPAHTL